MKVNIYEQLQSAKNQRGYVREVLFVGGLESWESKEYSALDIQYTEKIIDLEEKIKQYESVYLV